ncbi:hypothetical protein [Enterobacter sp. R4-368]|uniref:hypothetical protein n=1 Tax=Enterobacter sp. R4-368 TaxID=1166130 RepID=UPI00034F060A|nr:hypothetical protein [Enterobacter sp. R4-368]AGN84938.1 hypothetical protein H650_07010 [Enterobacter sp. R4-368]
MPVSSSDFLEFAKDCVTRNDEIGYRNAVARAYYGAYHHILPFIKYGPKDNHQGLIDYLMTASWKGNEPYSKLELTGLGMALQALKDQRIISDYRLNATVTANDSKTSIKTAEKLIAKWVDISKPKAS